MKLTPLQKRIVDALKKQHRQRMNYHSLMYELWPPDQHPKAWRHSSNGGPPGCCMAFGRALSQLTKKGLVRERPERIGRGDICLLSTSK